MTVVVAILVAGGLCALVLGLATWWAARAVAVIPLSFPSQRGQSLASGPGGAMAPAASRRADPGSCDQAEEGSARGPGDELPGGNPQLELDVPGAVHGTGEPESGPRIVWRRNAR